MENVEVKCKDGKLTVSVDVNNVKTTFCQTVEVNTSLLNIRSNHSQNSTKIGTLRRGNRVDIVDMFCNCNGYVWGKLSDEFFSCCGETGGWICLNYCTTVRYIMF